MNLEDWLYPLLAPYERLPRGIKRALGFSYRQMPQSWRLGRRYAEFRDLVAFGERWSPAETQAYQLEQLRAVLVEANQHCPFYRQAFARATACGTRCDPARTSQVQRE